jgi:hypothetical protein
MTPPSGSRLQTRPPGGGGEFADHDPPVYPDEQFGGGGSGWVALLRSPNDIDAHLLTGRLAEAGVESTTLKDRGAPGAWLHGSSNPWTPVTILVRKIQLEDARLVLAELAFERPAVEPKVVQTTSHWRAPIVWWATAIGLGLLFTGLGLVQAANDIERCSDPKACAEGSP